MKPADYKRKKRSLAIEKLGSKCRKCGFKDKRALQIDHINNDGSSERTKTVAIHNRIINDPAAVKRYQLLCANCNWLKFVENNDFKGRTLSTSRAQKADLTDIIGEVGLSHLLGNKLPGDHILTVTNLLMKNIFQWFVYSSANPSQVSLTVKGLLPLLLLVGVEATDELEAGIVSLVIGLGTFFSALITLIGFVRKVWLTSK